MKGNRSKQRRHYFDIKGGGDWPYHPISDSGLSTKNVPILRKHTVIAISVMTLLTVVLSLVGLFVTLPYSATLAISIGLNLLAIPGFYLLSYLFGKTRALDSPIEAVWRLQSATDRDKLRTAWNAFSSSPQAKSKLDTDATKKLLQFVETAISAVRHLGNGQRLSEAYDNSQILKALNKIKHSSANQSTKRKTERNYKIPSFDVIYSTLQKYQSTEKPPSNQAGLFLSGLLLINALLVTPVLLMLHLVTISVTGHSLYLAGLMVAGITVVLVLAKFTLERSKQHATSYVEFTAQISHPSKRLTGERLVIWIGNIALFAATATLAFLFGITSVQFLVLAGFTFVWGMGQIATSNFVQSSLKKKQPTSQTTHVKKAQSSPAVPLRKQDVIPEKTRTFQLAIWICDVLFPLATLTTGLILSPASAAFITLLAGTVMLGLLQTKFAKTRMQRWWNSFEFIPRRLPHTNVRIHFPRKKKAQNTQLGSLDYNQIGDDDQFTPPDEIGIAEEKSDRSSHSGWAESDLSLRSAAHSQATSHSSPSTLKKTSYFNIDTTESQRFNKANVLMNSYFVAGAIIGVVGNNLFSNTFFNMGWNFVGGVGTFPSIYANYKNNWKDRATREKAVTVFEGFAATVLIALAPFSAAAKRNPALFGKSASDIISALSGYGFALSMATSAVRAFHNFLNAWEKCSPRFLLEQRLKKYQEMAHTNHIPGEKEHLKKEILALIRVKPHELLEEGEQLRSIFQKCGIDDDEAISRENMDQAPTIEETQFVETLLKNNQIHRDQHLLNFFGHFAAAVCFSLLASGHLSGITLVTFGGGTNIFLVLAGAIKLIQLFFWGFNWTKVMLANSRRNTFLEKIAGEVDTFSYKSMYIESPTHAKAFKQFFDHNGITRDAGKATVKAMYYVRNELQVLKNASRGGLFSFFGDISDFPKADHNDVKTFLCQLTLPLHELSSVLARAQEIIRDYIGPNTHQWISQDNACEEFALKQFFFENDLYHSIDEKLAQKQMQLRAKYRIAYYLRKPNLAASLTTQKITAFLENIHNNPNKNKILDAAMEEFMLIHANRSQRRKGQTVVDTLTELATTAAQPQSTGVLFDNAALRTKAVNTVICSKSRLFTEPNVKKPRAVGPTRPTAKPAVEAATSADSSNDQHPCAGGQPHSNPYETLSALVQSS